MSFKVHFPAYRVVSLTAEDEVGHIRMAIGNCRVIQDVDVDSARGEIRIEDGGCVSWSDDEGVKLSITTKDVTLVKTYKARPEIMASFRAAIKEWKRCSKGMV